VANIGWHRHDDAHPAAGDGIESVDTVEIEPAMVRVAPVPALQRAHWTIRAAISTSKTPRSSFLALVAP
jgi:hypothetical protein